MSSYAAETTTLSERERRKADFKTKFSAKDILARLVDPKSDWILVPNGSFMGYFDWCPERLRLGPWSPLAPIYVLFLCLLTLSTFPAALLGDSVPHMFPDAYSPWWYYNLCCFLWMLGVLCHITTGPAGGFVLITYTIQSWTVLTARHGLSALAPFLPEHHVLLGIHEVLRFPALASATVTFFVWNFVIAPFVYFRAMDTPKKRADFLAWMTSFRLVQVHFFNFFFAVANAVVAPTASPSANNKTFSSNDLWCSLFCSVSYALFYLLVLDRLGIHLYPVFSPRTHFVVLTWTALLGFFCLTFGVWNRVIEDNMLISTVLN